MNRRHLAIIALIIAVPLFAAPLVSPVPDYGPPLEVLPGNEPLNFTNETVKEKRLKSVTTVQYQTLSPAARHVFDAAYTNTDTMDTTDYTVRLDKAPEPWFMLAPTNQDVGLDFGHLIIVKHGQYYSVPLSRFTPGPSLQEVMLRLGPLLGAIGLGTVADYLFLTAEE
jgi:hypothetical protein